MGRVVDDDGDPDRLIGLIALRNGGRAELLAAEAETPEGLKAGMADLAAVAEDARFVSAGAAPLEPPAAPGPLAGIWGGSHTTLGNELGADLTLQLVSRTESRRYTFYPSGHFAAGVSDGVGGVGAFVYDDAVARRTDDVGTYRVGPEAVALSYASGRTAELARQGELLRDGPVLLAPLRIPPDGFTFDGTTSRASHSSFGGGAMMRVHSSATHRTEYRRDGTYATTRDSFTSGTGGGVVVATGGGPDVERGIYRVAGGELARTDPGGDVDRVVIHLHEAQNDGGAAERTLYVGEDRVDTDDDLPPGTRAPTLGDTRNPLDPVNPLDP